jgi:hypothetical protein
VGSVLPQQFEPGRMNSNDGAGGQDPWRAFRWISDGD